MKNETIKMSAYVDKKLGSVSANKIVDFINS
jgi:hypothetical protein